MPAAETIGIFIPILAILMAGLIVLVPIAGLTARFALKPVIEAFVSLRARGGHDEKFLAVLEQRLALMEQQLHTLESSLHRLEEERSFERSLQAGRPEASPARTSVPVYRSEA
jgi:hypothetical protein